MVYSIDKVLQNTKAGSMPGSPLEDPLGHLVACHDRIEQRLKVLEKAPEYLLSGDSAKQREAMEAIRNAVRFLDTSGVQHTEDEEMSVFPRLRERIGDHPLLAQLEADHDAADKTYAALVESVRVLESGISTEAVDGFRTLVAELAGHYRPHIAMENEHLIPLAKQNLPPQEIDAIRDEMRRRRNL